MGIFKILRAAAYETLKTDTQRVPVFNVRWSNISIFILDLKMVAHEQLMNYVTPRISDGLGNRFFQVAAVLGYAEKYGHTPVFTRDRILSTNHSGPKGITDYFPELQTMPSLPDCTLLEESGSNTYTYNPFPGIGQNVCLKGYFQSETYFPSGGVGRPAILAGLDDRYADYAFLHVRRGDYLLPVCRHHYVDLTTYYRLALSFFKDSNTRILVCSDDMEWCQANLPKRYNDIISEDRWEFLPSQTSDYMTLRAMTACGRGGISANSTFSWWGAYWGYRTHGGRGFYTMPSTWGFPPLPPVKDLFPEWATLLPV